MLANNELIQTYVATCFSLYVIHLCLAVYFVCYHVTLGVTIPITHYIWDQIEKIRNMFKSESLKINWMFYQNCFVFLLFPSRFAWKWQRFLVQSSGTFLLLMKPIDWRIASHCSIRLCCRYVSIRLCCRYVIIRLSCRYISIRLYCRYVSIRLCCRYVFYILIEILKQQW